MGITTVIIVVIIDDINSFILTTEGVSVMTPIRIRNSTLRN